MPDGSGIRRCTRVLSVASVEDGGVKVVEDVLS